MFRHRRTSPAEPAARDHKKSLRSTILSAHDRNRKAVNRPGSFGRGRAPRPPQPCTEKSRSPVVGGTHRIHITHYYKISYWRNSLILAFRRGSSGFRRSTDRANRHNRGNIPAPSVRQHRRRRSTPLRRLTEHTRGISSGTPLFTDPVF